MNEVICHIGSYDAFEAYKLVWALMAMNVATIGVAAAVVLIIRNWWISR